MFLLYFNIISRFMRGSRGGGGLGGPAPPWNLQSLISPILLEMKKLVIFHICALLQLYVKQNQSYLRLDPPPPGKIFWIRAWRFEWRKFKAFF